MKKSLIIISALLLVFATALTACGNKNVIVDKNGRTYTPVTDKDGNKQERTEWHRVIFYRRLAEIVGQYLKKGSSVYLEGRIRTRKWTDKDGQERYTTEIEATEMQMLGGRSEQQEPAPHKEAAPDKKPSKPDFSDLEEKMDYYTAHPDEAQAIINHAHEYVEQFKDKQREDIISLMVLDKYFSLLKSKD